MHSRIEGHIAIVEHPKTPAKGSTQSSTGWRPTRPAKTPSEKEDFTGTATIQVIQCGLLDRGGVSEGEKKDVGKRNEVRFKRSQAVRDCPIWEGIHPRGIPYGNITTTSACLEEPSRLLGNESRRKRMA